MRLRIMEVEKIEGIVDKQTRVSSMEGNWEKMEVYEGAEAGGAQRQKRGIFMRDNVALARSLPSERCKPVFSFSCFKLFGLTLITSTPESRL